MQELRISSLRMSNIVCLRAQRSAATRSMIVDHRCTGDRVVVIWLPDSVMPNMRREYFDSVHHLYPLCGSQSDNRSMQLDSAAQGEVRAVLSEASVRSWPVAASSHLAPGVAVSQDAVVKLQLVYGDAHIQSVAVFIQMQFWPKPTLPQVQGCCRQTAAGPRG